MVAAGYDRPFSAAVTAAAAVLGPIIPPSIGMVIYSLVLGGQVSIAGLFLAGILPGLLLGGSLMVLCYLMARRRGYPTSHDRFSIRRVVSSLRGAILPLLAPVIILGGILGGVFTATESAAMAVVYVLLIGFLVTKTLNLREVVNALERTMVTTSVVTLLLATSQTLTWLITALHGPEIISNYIVGAGLSRTSFTILLLALLVVAGIIIEPVPLMVMFAPILAPVAYQLGMSPLHFGLVFVLAVEIGLITPPVGSVLFVICGVSRERLEVLSWSILPFMLVEITVLVFVAFVPQIALWIPHGLGFR
jgi:tripartite ATP-independent transporter DctM subunit